MTTNRDAPGPSAYPVSSTLLNPRDLQDAAPLPLSDFLEAHPERCTAHPYLPDVARIEEITHRLKKSPPVVYREVDALTVNPTLELLPVGWEGLPAFVKDRSSTPRPGSAHVLVVKRPGSEDVEVRTAEPADLLALKIVVEEREPRRVASDCGVPVGSVDDVLHRAVHRGLLLAPASRIQRSADFPRGVVADPSRLSSPTFTLQWHITQACDLDCRHCYDRSERSPMPLKQGIGVLDDLYDFCREHHVYGQISFSGGNPLLYPHFDRLYREAAHRGFLTAVLGNPAPRRRIERMLAVRKPEFYQISLEGLASHNDSIRGSGHWERSMAFLDTLGELGVYRMVMLTLTRDNVDQVIELAHRLRGRAEHFTFNRLAPVGRGADLAPVAPERYRSFLSEYMDAAGENPIMGLKDNLFNWLLHQGGRRLGGGCAGHGCGAAFNFVALLPDGEVHACRKLPSLIGNIYRNRLAEIYHSRQARRYRLGTTACSGCDIRPVCGGCPAVVHGLGGDVFHDRDPYCIAFENLHHR